MEFPNLQQDNIVLYWIGPRESDMDFTGDLFKGSVTVYGSGKNGNSAYARQRGLRVNHNIVTEDQIEFNVYTQKALIKKHSNTKFMSYNPYYAYIGDEEIQERTVCLNKLSILEKLRDKAGFRNFAKSIIPIPEYKLLSRSQCSYDSLRTSFSKWHKFVIQKRVSSGGMGTYVISENSPELPAYFRDDTDYLASPLYDQNIPVNVHAIIYENDIILFPPSIQIVIPNEGMLLYRGADYIAYKAIPNSLDLKFKKSSLSLLKEIQKIGYRGVIGLDAIFLDDDVLFLEANVRFQASSQVLNASLAKQGLPSLQELNYEAFSQANCSHCKDEFSNLEHLYSSFSYTSHDRQFADYILPLFEANPNVLVAKDGYDNSEAESDTYLYRIGFDQPISWAFGTKEVRIQQNLTPASENWGKRLLANDATALKISLMNQGIRMTEQVRKTLSSLDEFSSGVNDAIDIELQGFCVNAPINTPYSYLSPFMLRFSDNSTIAIDYLEKKTWKVKLATDNSIWNTASAKHKKIAFLATDRLRLSYTDGCDFVSAETGCKFCNLNPSIHGCRNVNEMQDAFDWCNKNLKFDHVLIGGGTDTSQQSFDAIIESAKYIRSTSSYPIYVMCVPPKNLNLLDKMKAAGVTEVGFNIEIANRQTARKIMPAKGKIDLNRYYSALSYSCNLWGKEGQVRSALIVGIDAAEDLYECVTHLASIGVQPILSLFRPLKGTQMQHIVPPSNEEVSVILTRCHEICEKHGVRLGPSCTKCQNNTLNMIE